MYEDVKMFGCNLPMLALEAAQIWIRQLNVATGRHSGVVAKKSKMVVNLIRTRSGLQQLDIIVKSAFVEIRAGEFHTIFNRLEFWQRQQSSLITKMIL